MAKAQSFKSEPWTSLEKGSWKVFDTDFIHDVIGFKLSKKSSTSTIECKSSFSLNKEGKVGNHKEELKFWFPIPNQRTLYFRLKGDHWKFMIDNGVRQHNGYNLNLYGCVQGKKLEIGSNQSVKVGLEVADKDWSTDVRVTSVPKEKSIEVYNKTKIRRPNWSYEFINGLNVFNKTWAHSTVQISHTCNDSDYNIRADAGQKHTEVHPKNYLTHIIANYLYHYSKSTTVGFQANFDLTNPKVLVGGSAIWDYVQKDKPNTGIKVKADLNRNVGVAITNDIKDYGKYIFGINISDFGQSNRFAYGVEINLNL